MKALFPSLLCPAGCAVLALHLAILPAPALAQSREAVVVAGSDGSLPDATAREAALDVSELLSGLGFVVNRLEAPSAERLEAALARLGASGGTAVFYHAGALDAVAPEVALATPDGPRLLTAILPGMGDPAGGELLVLLDGCIGALRQPDLTGAAHVVDAEAGDSVDPLAEASEADSAASLDALRPGVFLALSGGPGQPCPEPGTDGLTGLMLARLGAPGVAVEAVFAGADLAAPPVLPAEQAAAVAAPLVQVRSGLAAPVVLRPAESGLRLTAADYAMLDGLDSEMREQMIALWTQAGIPVDLVGGAGGGSDPVAVPQSRAGTIVATSPVRPVASALAVSPVRAALPAPGSTPGSTPVQLIAQPAAAIARAVPGSGGLPEPSIIVGFPAPPAEAEDLPRVDPEAEPVAVAGAELQALDTEARAALRASDEDLFISLVNAGAFDPAEADLARAIQAELQRMNCYTGALDGVFGAGSRRALNAYYDEIGLAAPSQDPTVEIYRQTLLRDDVTCPTPVAAPAPTANAGGAQQRPATQQQAPRQQTAAPPAPPPPQAPTQTQRGFTQNSLQTGTFR